MTPAEALATALLRRWDGAEAVLAALTDAGYALVPVYNGEEPFVPEHPDHEEEPEGAQVYEFGTPDRIARYAGELTDDAVLDILGHLLTLTVGDEDDPAEQAAWDALLDQVERRPDLLLQVRVAAAVWGSLAERPRALALAPLTLVRGPR